MASNDPSPSRISMKDIRERVGKLEAAASLVGKQLDEWPLPVDAGANLAGTLEAALRQVELLRLQVDGEHRKIPAGHRLPTEVVLQILTVDYPTGYRRCTYYGNARLLNRAVCDHVELRHQGITDSIADRIVLIATVAGQVDAAYHRTLGRAANIFIEDYVVQRLKPALAVSILSLCKRLHTIRIDERVDIEASPEWQNLDRFVPWSTFVRRRVFQLREAHKLVTPREGWRQGLDEVRACIRPPTTDGIASLLPARHCLHFLKVSGVTLTTTMARTLRLPHLRELVLINAQLDDESAAALDLAHDTSIRRLNVSFNNIRRPSVLGLAANAGLVSLEACKNPMEDYEFGLELNTVLERLDLQDPDPIDSAFPADWWAAPTAAVYAGLTRQLQCNTSLRFLALDHRFDQERLAALDLPPDGLQHLVMDAWDPNAAFDAGVASLISRAGELVREVVHDRKTPGVDFIRGGDGRFVAHLGSWDSTCESEDGSEDYQDDDETSSEEDSEDETRSCDYSDYDGPPGGLHVREAMRTFADGGWTSELSVAEG